LFFLGFKLKSAVQKIVGITDARNQASIRLLERVGMHKTKSEEAIFRGAPCIEHYFEITKDGFAQSNK